MPPVNNLTCLLIPCPFLFLPAPPLLSSLLPSSPLAHPPRTPRPVFRASLLLILSRNPGRHTVSFLLLFLLVLHPPHSATQPRSLPILHFLLLILPHSRFPIIFPLLILHSLLLLPHIPFLATLFFLVLLLIIFFLLILLLLPHIPFLTFLSPIAPSPPSFWPPSRPSRPLCKSMKVPSYFIGRRETYRRCVCGRAGTTARPTCNAAPDRFSVAGYIFNVAEALSCPRLRGACELWVEGRG